VAATGERLIRGAATGIGRGLVPEDTRVKNSPFLSQPGSAYYLHVRTDSLRLQGSDVFPGALVLVGH
jgi:hypothetical protein